MPKTSWAPRGKAAGAKTKSAAKAAAKRAPAKPTAKAPAKKSAAKVAAKVTVRPAAKPAAKAPAKTARRTAREAARSAVNLPAPPAAPASARPNPAAPPAPAAPVDVGGRTLVAVPVGLIDPSPWQPRTDWDSPEAIAELKDLEASLAEPAGLLQPVSLRPIGARYQLVAGERRWRAATNLHWDTIPAVVRDISDEDAATLAGIENLARRDLSPWEEADLYARRMAEFGWSQAEVARRFKRPTSVVSDRLGLFKTPEPWQGELRRGRVLQISHGVAFAPYRAAPDAVHQAAYERIQSRQEWAAAQDGGKPVPVDAFPRMLFAAYAPDLRVLDTEGDRTFDAEAIAAYRGPVVTVARDGWSTPVRHAADPEQWRPLHEATLARRREAAREQAAAAELAEAAASRQRMDDTVHLAKHHRDADRAASGEPHVVPARPVAAPAAPAPVLDLPPGQAFRGDVVLALPESARVLRMKYPTQPPDGVQLLTTAEGRWAVDPLGRPPAVLACDPADLVLDPAALVLVEDPYERSRRVGTTELDIVRVAEEAWEARWDARREALGAGPDAAACHLTGPGVRHLLARECGLAEDVLWQVVRDVADAHGLALPEAVVEEVGSPADSDGYAGAATAAWLRDEAPQAVVEDVAGAWLRGALIEDASEGVEEAVRQEQAAAWRAIAERPVPWVVERPGGAGHDAAAPGSEAAESPVDVVAHDQALADAAVDAAPELPAELVATLERVEEEKPALPRSVAIAVAAHRAALADGGSVDEAVRAGTRALFDAEAAGVEGNRSHFPPDVRAQFGTAGTNHMRITFGIVSVETANDGGSFRFHYHSSKAADVDNAGRGWSGYWTARWCDRFREDFGVPISEAIRPGAVVTCDDNPTHGPGKNRIRSYRPSADAPEVFPAPKPRARDAEEVAHA